MSYFMEMGYTMEYDSETLALIKRNLEHMGIPFEEEIGPRDTHMKNYYLSNRERLLKYTKEYNKKHSKERKEYYDQYNKEYYLRNREKIIEQSKAYRKANPEKRRRWNKAYCERKKRS